KTNIEPDKLRQLLDLAEQQGMTLGQLPRLTDFRSDIGPQRLEPTQIPIEDLLGRPRRVLDREAMGRLIAGRRVLVTGAGGTIGGELTRQIAAFKPAHLALIENSEFALYNIDLELSQNSSGVACESILGDVRDRARLDQVMALVKPE